MNFATRIVGGLVGVGLVYGAYRIAPLWGGAALVLVGLAVAPFVSRGPRLAVVYDGGCDMCRRALARLVSIDWADRIEALSVTEWESVASRFPELDERACMRDMHAIDGAGRSHPGYGAYQKIAWRLPLLAPFAWLMYVPPIPQIGRRVYRRVADNRLRDRCEGPR